MSYRFLVQTKKPVASWILDDTYPFQDWSGWSTSATKKTGTTDPTKSTALHNGAEYSTVFKSTSIGQFTSTVFEQGRESDPFALEAWVLPIPKTTTGDQQILSHDTFFDGLSINGKVVRFGTQYLTTGTAFCTFDLGEYRAAHLVGVHSKERNELWVNGKMVSYVDITLAQQADSYIATGGLLYSGASSSNQEIAMNGVAIYSSIKGEDIVNNYINGINVMSQDAVCTQFQGQGFSLATTGSSRYIYQTWSTKSDFQAGLKTNVEYSDEQIVPSLDSSSTSVAGNWVTALQLDAQGDTSIYGAMINWSGQGITVDTSLDGTTWAAATNGALVAAITSGYNPTGKDLYIRVSFAGGVLNDPAYLEYISMSVYRDNTFLNQSSRSVTVSYPAVLRDNYEPILYRDDNGVNLHGGTLTIGTDGNSVPQVARTVELWIKPISGTPTVSATGTKYRNGLADSTMPVGEWTCQHIVAASDILTTITVTGDCIVGRVVLYPTALSADDIATIYDSYTGYPTIRISDSASIGVSEPATPTVLYDKDWSISPAG